MFFVSSVVGVTTLRLGYKMDLLTTTTPLHPLIESCHIIFAMVVVMVMVMVMAVVVADSISHGSGAGTPARTAASLCV